jgi:hypothetical protein
MMEEGEDVKASKAAVRGMDDEEEIIRNIESSPEDEYEGNELY